MEVVEEDEVITIEDDTDDFVDTAQQSSTATTILATPWRSESR